MSNVLIGVAVVIGIILALVIDLRIRVKTVEAKSNRQAKLILNLKDMINENKSKLKYGDYVYDTEVIGDFIYTEEFNKKLNNYDLESADENTKLNAKVDNIRDEIDIVKWSLSHTDIKSLDDVFKEVKLKVEEIGCDKVEQIVVNSKFIIQYEMIFNSKFYNDFFDNKNSVIKCTKDGQEYYIDVVRDDIDKDYEIVFLNKQYSLDK